MVGCWINWINPDTNKDKLISDAKQYLIDNFESTELRKMGFNNEVQAQWQKSQAKLKPNLNKQKGSKSNVNHPPSFVIFVFRVLFVCFMIHFNLFFCLVLMYSCCL